MIKDYRDLEKMKFKCLLEELKVDREFDAICKKYNMTLEDRVRLDALKLKRAKLLMKRLEYDGEIIIVD